LPAGRLLLRAFATLALLAGAPNPASAQVFEAVGIRAQGMAGAFVAVADDASATWWNPAGLAGGAYFSSIIEFGSLQEPREATRNGIAVPSWREETRSFALAYPALGLSYYHLRLSEIRLSNSTGPEVPGREDSGPSSALMSSMVLQQFGLTVGQSLGDSIVLGSTLKVVHGSLAASIVNARDASFDRAADLDAGGETHLDLDMGAMFRLGRSRFGVTVKNLREPGFGEGGNRVDLSRQARVGFATTTAGARAFTFAVDADITRTATAAGEARHLAGGLEAWVVPKRVGLRGGVSGNTVGPTRLSPSAGVSVAVRSGILLDAQGTWGSDESRKGLGFDVRMTF
jgi:F plasmid transfer operon, TraF, protein